MAFLRKSIYATGGVIGVFKAPSTPAGVCGSRLNVADIGERGSSEGNAGDLNDEGTELATLIVGVIGRVDFVVEDVGGGEGIEAGRAVDVDFSLPSLPAIATGEATVGFSVTVTDDTGNEEVSVDIVSVGVFCVFDGGAAGVVGVFVLTATGDCEAVLGEGEAIVSL